jgi:hypothetical protein
VRDHAVVPQPPEPLTAPEDHEWLRAFGTTPSDEEITGDDLVREVKIDIGNGLLHLTWDVVDASVRVRWIEDDIRVVDVFRERASTIGIESPKAGVTQVRIIFAAPEVTDLLVTVWPRFRLEDVPARKRLSD